MTRYPKRCYKNSLFLGKHFVLMIQCLMLCRQNESAFLTSLYSKRKIDMTDAEELFLVAIDLLEFFFPFIFG